VNARDADGIAAALANTDARIRTVAGFGSRRLRVSIRDNDKLRFGGNRTHTRPFPEVQTPRGSSYAAL
jgi:hypothetical protein